MPNEFLKKLCFKEPLHKKWLSNWKNKPGFIKFQENLAIPKEILEELAMKLSEEFQEEFLKKNGFDGAIAEKITEDLFLKDCQWNPRSNYWRHSWMRRSNFRRNSQINYWTFFRKIFRGMPEKHTLKNTRTIIRWAPGRIAKERKRNNYKDCPELLQEFPEKFMEKALLNASLLKTKKEKLLQKIIEESNK